MKYKIGHYQPYDRISSEFDTEHRDGSFWSGKDAEQRIEIVSLDAAVD
jgi:hypothetical protein